MPGRTTRRSSSTTSLSLAQLPAQARLVEIGCGTGQATLPLAERGYAITCVELGERLAAAARRKLAAFPSVSVINANFETWQPERRGFDARRCFRRIPLARARSALHEDGRPSPRAREARLRLDGTRSSSRRRSVLPRSPGRLRGSYPGCTRERRPAPAGASTRLPGGYRIRMRSAITATKSWRRARASGRFHKLEREALPLGRDLQRRRYIAVLDTYSDHRALDDEARERLLERIHRRIEARPERTVRNTYLAMLYVAERV